MSDLDRYLTDEVVEASVQALRVAGLADADGHGYVLENVYADGAAYVALEAVLPDIIQQAKAEAWDEGRSMSELTWRHIYDGHDCAEGEMCPSCGAPNPYRADLIEQGGQP